MFLSPPISEYSEILVFTLLIFYCQQWAVKFRYFESCKSTSTASDSFVPAACQVDPQLVNYLWLTYLINNNVGDQCIFFTGLEYWTSNGFRFELYKHKTRQHRKITQDKSYGNNKKYCWNYKVQIKITNQFKEV